MNLIKADDLKCEYEYDQLNCKSYKIIKEWKDSI